MESVATWNANLVSVLSGRDPLKLYIGTTCGSWLLADGGDTYEATKLKQYDNELKEIEYCHKFKFAALGFQIGYSRWICYRAGQRGPNKRNPSSGKRRVGKTDLDRNALDIIRVRARIQSRYYLGS